MDKAKKLEKALTACAGKPRQGLQMTDAMFFLLSYIRDHWPVRLDGINVVHFVSLAKLMHLGLIYGEPSTRKWIPGVRREGQVGICIGASILPTMRGLLIARNIPAELEY